MGGGADFDPDIAGKDEGKFMFLLNLIADKTWCSVLDDDFDVCVGCAGDDDSDTEDEEESKDGVAASFEPRPTPASGESEAKA